MMFQKLLFPEECITLFKYTEGLWGTLNKLDVGGGGIWRDFKITFIYSDNFSNTFKKN